MEDYISGPSRKEIILRNIGISDLEGILVGELGEKKDLVENEGKRWKVISYKKDDEFITEVFGEYKGEWINDYELFNIEKNPVKCSLYHKETVEFLKQKPYFNV